jgi:UDP-N-acetyl-2-amino-2-deoxyglucuronate dehydrogenase
MGGRTIPETGVLYTTAGLWYEDAVAAPLRFVIVGSGNIAATFVRALRAVPDAVLAGVVSRSLSRPAGVDAPLEARRSLREWGDACDAVILATPNALHAEGAVEAAHMGRHVLTEKPLAVSLESADRAIAACHAAGVTLGVCYQRRMSRDNRSLHALIAGNRLGRVLAADVAVKFFRDQGYYAASPYRGTWAMDGGGPFMQQACHQVDLYTWFFGLPRRVRSVVGTLAHRMEAEDHGAAVMEHDNGMIGTFVASTLARPGFPARVEIHTEAGSVVMENDVITRWLVDGVPNPSRPPEAPLHSGAGAAGAAVTDTAGHEAIVADFVRAVRENRPPAVTGEDARRATDLILQIYRAARD